MTEVNVRTGGINSQLDTHWPVHRRQQFIQAQMDRLNQADLENLLRRDAAMQSEGR